MPGTIVFTAPIRGAQILGARIRESGRANLSEGHMALVIQFYGAAGTPGVPADGDTPEVPAIDEVAHPTNFTLTVSNTISDAVKANPRAVDGLEQYRLETPGAFNALMMALAGGLQTRTSEALMLGVLAQHGILPAGVAS